MSGAQGQSRKVLPPPPPERTFVVTSYDSENEPVEETIVSHDYVESPFGSLTFIQAVPFGEIYVKRVVRYFAAGEVKEFRETTSYEPQLISLVTH